MNDGRNAVIKGGVISKRKLRLLVASYNHNHSSVNVTDINISGYTGHSQCIKIYFADT